MTNSDLVKITKIYKESYYCKDIEKKKEYSKKYGDVGWQRCRREQRSRGLWHPVQMCYIDSEKSSPGR